MKELKIVCDFREDFRNYATKDVFFNDHPSRNSVEEIYQILSTSGYECEIFGGVNELISAYNQKISFTNCIFINMSDGLTQPYSRIQVPMLCEMLNIQYSGSPIFAVALMNNKHYAKLSVKEINVNVPEGILINRITDKTPSLHNFPLPKYPLIIKPNTEGSSLGISDANVCYNIQQLSSALNTMKGFKEIVIEQYIPGYEITNLIIGNPGDYRFNEVIITTINEKLYLSHEVQGLKEKSQKLRKQYAATDFIDAKICEQIKQTSQQIFEHMGARDIARIDYRVTEKGEIYFLEINSVPRVSSTSECAIICEKHKLSFKDVLLEYVSTIDKRISNRAKI